MVVKNIRIDLIYKNINNIVMVHDSLVNILDVDSRLLYALISNFEDGIDTKYIYELMEPKGWTREVLDNNINLLLDLNFIEDVGENIDLNKIKTEFESFKKQLFRI
ncbi:hypothetical protein LPC27_13345 [Paraclostridium bifermentans]|uniref:Uncharacterized protein n=1 Tax=Paraclostridium bifermentans TaxID=1490 RepID=A0A1X2JEN9_PARBF|nr:hypothetical protein [Paraclostridium bifermentans]KGJ49023.1 hypothetical protein KD33_11660 [Clostridium sp. NCR]MDM8127179.1 hypothetical protein [Paraclostridium benzoelyticum]EQK39576.1 hypothetical protein C671_3026 [[Clostridium] bifermentans ATCC 19299] [Paraclostridium bifermentans ATCC 19299]MBN8049190.1 hypothetical protein [Paraclostridium bifermentans]MBZ6007616.1 hypothetical protein [Paraclostridium bifermentans]